MADVIQARLDPEADAVTDRIRLRILATSDLHAHVIPWDYHADKPTAGNGLARTAGLIAAARAEVPGALLFDNGDFLNGSPISELGALLHESHPMIAAMNALGYDAATLGNHEFSHGLAALRHALAKSDFPVVSSNMLLRRGATAQEDRHVVAPRLILRRELPDAAGRLHEVRIGVIGFAPPQVVLWERVALGDDLEVRDIVEAATHHVAALRAEGVDVVVALAHSGIEGTAPLPMMENATAALAGLPGIDVVIAGHTHQTFPSVDVPAAVASRAAGIDAARGLIHGKPVVMPGAFGSHLGVIDLDLLPGPGGWRIAQGRATLRPIARRLPAGGMRALTRSDPVVTALADPAHRFTRAWAREVVGQTLAPLHSYFAMVSASAPVRLIAQAQADHVAQLLQGTPLEALPVLSAAAPFHAGGRGGPENFAHVPAGRLTRRHVFDLYPHPNAIAALLMQGFELAEWLERAFSQFHRIAPGSQDAELVDEGFPSFNFDLIEGLTWEVDLSVAPRYDTRGVLRDGAARRVRDLCWQGQPLDPAQRFVLATNSYRATGSGGFPVGRPEQLLLKGPRASRDVLGDHIGRIGAIAAAGPAPWRFRPMPGTTVTFESAPVAGRYLHEMAALRPEPLGLTPGGFRRFRLHL